MKATNFKELIAWKKAMELTIEVYKLIKLLPIEERFALADQMRRAAVSIPSNIAEGHSRTSTKEYLHFLSIARGSKSELETQLYICVELNYLNRSFIEKSLLLIDEIGRLTFSYINEIGKSNPPKP